MGKYYSIEIVINSSMLDYQIYIHI
jgi:hypothetical protein